jgi:hypothetical protein
VPLRVPGHGQLFVLKLIGLSFLLCNLSRFHEYICCVTGATREPEIGSILSAPITVGAFTTSDNLCQSSDDLEDAILGPLTLDVPDDVIDTAISNASMDVRSALMDGESSASTMRRAK